MITTAEEFLDMVTINKDRELGQWDREYVHGMIIHVMKTVAKMPFPEGKIEVLLNAIEAAVNEKMLEKTNVTIHFVIQANSMQQYVTPYTKKYCVGKTSNGIEEKILWILRPEYVKAGYISEITEQVGYNRSLKDTNTHEFGICEEYFNVVALHTHQYDNVKKIEFSDIHICVLIPCGSLISEISSLHHARMKSDAHMQNLLKEGKRLEKKYCSKKGSKVLKRPI